MTQDPGRHRDHPAGPGPAENLFENLFADDGDDPARHLALRAGEHGDLVGPLLVRAGTLERFRTALPADAHRLRVHLVADAPDARDGLGVLREARNGLFDDDRVEVVGVQLALPASARPAEAAEALLDALDFTAPAWIEVPLVAGWQDALAAIREDGTENVAVDAATAPEPLAAFVDRCVGLGLTFRVTGRPARPLPGEQPGDRPGDRPGGQHGPADPLTLLSAVLAAVAGADRDRVAAVLGSADAAAPAAALRATDPARAAAARAVLASIDTQDVEAVPTRLRREGLLR